MLPLLVHYLTFHAVHDITLILGMGGGFANDTVLSLTLGPNGFYLFPNPGVHPVGEEDHEPVP